MEDRLLQCKKRNHHSRWLEIEQRFYVIEIRSPSSEWHEAQDVLVVARKKGIEVPSVLVELKIWKAARKKAPHQFKRIIFRVVYCSKVYSVMAFCASFWRGSYRPLKGCRIIQLVLGCRKGPPSISILCFKSSRPLMYEIFTIETTFHLKKKHKWYYWMLVIKIPFTFIILCFGSSNPFVYEAAFNSSLHSCWLFSCPGFKIEAKRQLQEHNSSVLNSRSDCRFRAILFCVYAWVRIPRTPFLKPE